MKGLRESLNATLREKLEAIGFALEIRLLLDLGGIEERLMEKLEERLRERGLPARRDGR